MEQLHCHEVDSYTALKPDLRGGPFASRCAAIGVGVDVANRFWRASNFPWVTRSYLEFDDARVERMMEGWESERPRALIDRQSAREFAAVMCENELASLPMFSLLIAFNHAAETDRAVLRQADAILNASEDLAIEDAERRAAKAHWGQRHSEGLRRVRSRLARLLAADRTDEFDDEFTELLSCMGSHLERASDHHDHEWFREWHGVYPATIDVWARDADRQAMLASVDAVIAEARRGRSKSDAAAELEAVCRRTYLALTGRARVRYTKSDPEGGDYGRFLAAVYQALGREPPSQRLFAKAT